MLVDSENTVVDYGPYKGYVGRITFATASEYGEGILLDTQPSVRFSAVLGDPLNKAFVEAVDAHIELLRLQGIPAAADAVCANCIHFASRPPVWCGGGLCLRYPKSVSKHESETCGEFRIANSQDWHIKDVDAPSWFSKATVATLRRNHIRKIGQLLACSPASLVDAHGRIDAVAVQEISRRLACEGIKW